MVAYPHCQQWFLELVDDWAARDVLRAKHPNFGPYLSVFGKQAWAQLQLWLLVSPHKLC